MDDICRRDMLAAAAAGGALAVATGAVAQSVDPVAQPPSPLKLELRTLAAFRKEKVPVVTD